MKWTKKLPTEAGWYWQRLLTLQGHRTRILQVVKLEDGSCHELINNSLHPVEYSKSFHICYAGPIPLPDTCESVSECEEICKDIWFAS